MVFVEKWLPDDAKGMTLIVADRIATIFTKRYEQEGFVVACSLTDAPLRADERHPSFKLSPHFPDISMADIAAIRLAQRIATSEPGSVIGWDCEANDWSVE